MPMIRFVVPVLFLVWGALPVFSRDTLSLEKIWASGSLSPRGAGSFLFLQDGRHYTRLNQNAIVRYDLLTGREAGIILDGRDSLAIQGYSFSGDERYLLIEAQRESIYRHSYRAEFRVWDRERNRMTRVAGGDKVRYATFSPDGRQVAFVRDNDLYVQDLASGRETRITADGEENVIINGASDWVYEEEFHLVRAFEWSPDGTRLAWLRFDEREVPEFTLEYHVDQPYPRAVRYKYPKVGEANAVVSVHVHDLASGETWAADTGQETDIYFPRIAWTANAKDLCVFRMNRHQNELELLLFDVGTRQRRTLLREVNDRYIDIHDNQRFLSDGRHFLWTSERDGYNHLYLYDMQGRLVRQLTDGDWELTEFYGVDEKRRQAYFQAARLSPLQREVYAVSLDGGEPVRIRGGEGVHGAHFSATFDYLVGQHSTINSPPVHQVFRRDGSLVRTIEDNQALVEQQRRHGVHPLSFFEFTTSDGVSLNGWMLKPRGFDPARRYPVLMFLYGGPGSQQVLDAWRGANYWWFQLLADRGFLVACVDNRGTGGRGEDFKKCTYLQLGHYETLDQIEAARYLGGLPYVDRDRIGIYGWSYGGYMSTLCLLKGNDVFKAAVAVAPVTNWKWYDSIYTERYMRTERENPEGYRQNAPVYFADRLKGKYLLIHGMADDNVHFQNAVEMSEALVRANKPFEMAFYPNRHHGISGGPARLHLYTRMTGFLESALELR